MTCSIRSYISVDPRIQNATEVKSSLFTCLVRAGNKVLVIPTASDTQTWKSWLGPLTILWRTSPILWVVFLQSCVAKIPSHIWNTTDPNWILLFLFWRLYNTEHIRLGMIRCTKTCSSEGWLALLLLPLTKTKLKGKSREVWSIWNANTKRHAYKDSGGQSGQWNESKGRILSYI